MDRSHRLLRSTVAHSALKVARVPFVALDNESANELTPDILVAVAADERREIGERTKAALGALKARGVPLGAARLKSRNLDRRVACAWRAGCYGLPQGPCRPRLC